jgi:aquaporin-4
MASAVQRYVAELVGTYILVFFGSTSVTMVSAINAGPMGLLIISLAHALALALAVYMFGGVSGAHVNPAITIAQLIYRGIRGLDALGYIVFQLVGAALAGLTQRALLPTLGAATEYGLTKPTSLIGGDLGLAAVIELVLTFFLGLGVELVVLQRVPSGSSGFVIGFTLGMAILVGGPLTGASLNPARTFGPAIASMDFSAFWPYVVGPVVGAILGTGVGYAVGKGRT